jgi:hypothetical protein
MGVWGFGMYAGNHCRSTGGREVLLKNSRMAARLLRMSNLDMASRRPVFEL